MALRCDLTCIFRTGFRLKLCMRVPITQDFHRTPNDSFLKSLSLSDSLRKGFSATSCFEMFNNNNNNNNKSKTCDSYVPTGITEQEPRLPQVGVAPASSRAHCPRAPALCVCVCVCVWRVFLHPALLSATG
uniref:Uncharacterized protein n=1 Tax=Myotis myotis TaxID=51298 RepID=A0A7J7TJ74_MYOMY|nr:hypothetical protein mMyoMyo1_009056 [Myotis myotis]